MKIRVNSLRLMGFAAILVAITTAVFSFENVRNSIADIRLHWRHNLLWTSSQLGIEYFRFREALLAFGQEGFNVGKEDIDKRFNVLWSSVAVFQKGKISEQIAPFPGAGEVIARLQDTLTSQEEVIANLKEGDHAAARAIWKAFAAREDDFRRINRVVMRGEVEIGGRLRDGLLRNQEILQWLGSGAAGLSLVLLFFFAAETRWHRKVSKENARLYREAQAANRTKTAFLNMMSHDIRTPMNGILGMIELAKQRGNDPFQQQLLDIAVASSKQMNGLLSDILEFAALEGADAELKNGPFNLKTLRDKIAGSLIPVDSGGNAKFDISYAPENPVILWGDQARIRQALVFLARCLGKATGHKVQMHLSFIDETFVAYLSYQPGNLGADWVPGFLTAQDGKYTEELATEELGSAIASRFIKRMGGNLVQGVSDGGGVVVVHIPVTVCPEQKGCVRIETRSRALYEICKNALVDTGVGCCKADSKGHVQTVIIEAGGDFERNTCRELRQKYPRARFVALGNPCDASMFEIILPVPVSNEELKKAILV